MPLIPAVMMMGSTPPILAEIGVGGGRCIIQFVGGGLGWESIVIIGEFNNCFLRLGWV